MKVTVNRKALTTELALLAGASGRNNAVPVLNTVLLRARDGKIELQATDLEIGLRTGIDADNVEPGETTDADAGMTAENAENAESAEED